jgi:hypothetical protein
LGDKKGGKFNSGNESSGGKSHGRNSVSVDKTYLAADNSDRRSVALCFLAGIFVIFLANLATTTRQRRCARDGKHSARGCWKVDDGGEGKKQFNAAEEEEENEWWTGK